MPRAVGMASVSPFHRQFVQNAIVTKIRVNQRRQRADVGPNKGFKLHGAGILHVSVGHPCTHVGTQAAGSLFVDGAAGIVKFVPDCDMSGEENKKAIVIEDSAICGLQKTKMLDWMEGEGHSMAISIIDDVGAGADAVAKVGDDATVRGGDAGSVTTHSFAGFWQRNDAFKQVSIMVLANCASVMDIRHTQRRELVAALKIQRRVLKRKVQPWKQRSLAAGGVPVPSSTFTVPKGIIHPHHPKKMAWDVFVMALIMWSCIVIPYFFAFVPVNLQYLPFCNGWCQFGIVVDIFFLVDIAFTFRTALELKDPDQIDPLLVTDPRRIAKCYLSGWFGIDLLSTIPLSLIIGEIYKASLGPSGDADSQTNLDFTKMLRMLRIIRLFKLARMFKLDRLFRKMEAAFDISREMIVAITMVRLMFIMIFIAHLSACILFMAQFPADLKQPNCQKWVTNASDPAAGGHNVTACVTWAEAYENDLGVPYDKYIASMYYAMTVMTTVGFGDVSAMTDGERLFLVGFMLIVVSVFGYIIGLIQITCKSLQDSDVEYKAKLLEVRKWLLYRRIDPSTKLYARIMEYFEEHWAIHSDFDENFLLGELSPSLRNEVLVTFNSALVDFVPMLSSKSSTNYLEFCSAFVSAFETMTCNRGDVLCYQGDLLHQCFFVIRGTIELRNSVYEPAGSPRLVKEPLPTAELEAAKTLLGALRARKANKSDIEQAQSEVSRLLAACGMVGRTVTHSQGLVDRGCFGDRSLLSVYQVPFTAQAQKYTEMICVTRAAAQEAVSRFPAVHRLWTGVSMERKAAEGDLGKAATSEEAQQKLLSEINRLKLDFFTSTTACAHLEAKLVDCEKQLARANDALSDGSGEGGGGGGGGSDPSNHSYGKGGNDSIQVASRHGGLKGNLLPLFGGLSPAPLPNMQNQAALSPAGAGGRKNGNFSPTPGTAAGKSAGGTPETAVAQSAFSLDGLEGIELTLGNNTSSHHDNNADSESSELFHGNAPLGLIHGNAHAHFHHDKRVQDFERDKRSHKDEAKTSNSSPSLGPSHHASHHATTGGTHGISADDRRLSGSHSSLTVATGSKDGARRVLERRRSSNRGHSRQIDDSSSDDSDGDLEEGHQQAAAKLTASMPTRRGTQDQAPKGGVAVAAAGLQAGGVKGSQGSTIPGGHGDDDDPHSSGDEEEKAESAEEAEKAMEMARKRSDIREQTEDTFDSSVAVDKFDQVCPLHPQHPFLPRWDGFMGLLIIYSVIEIPYRFCFKYDTGCNDDMTDNPDCFFQVLNYTFDVFFFMDICKEFNTAFIDPVSNRLIRNHKAIASRYLGGMFVIDVLSTLPFNLFLQDVAGDSGGGAGAANITKLLRILKIVRLAKLARLLKLQKTLNSLEGNAPLLIKIVKLTFMMAMLIHLQACCFYAIASDPFSSEYAGKPGTVLPGSWVDVYGQNLGTGTDGFNHYIASIYWSMTTTTTVGYGDILPVTDAERMFVTVVMLVGIGFFGYVVGEMTTVFVDAASNGEMLQQRLKEIRSWAQSRRLSDALLKRLKVYVTAEFDQVGEFNETDLLKTMYPSLRIDLMHHILGDCIYKVKFFVQCDSTFLTRMLCSLVPVTVNSEESIARRGDWQYELFFLLSGTAFIEGKVSVKPGTVKAGTPTTKHKQQQQQQQANTQSNGDGVGEGGGEGGGIGGGGVRRGDASRKVSVHDLSGDGGGKTQRPSPRISIPASGPSVTGDTDSGLGEVPVSKEKTTTDDKGDLFLHPVESIEILAVLRDGAFFSSEILQGGNVNQVVAGSVCDLFVLHRDALLGILENYPHYAQQIAQIKRWRAKDDTISSSNQGPSGKGFAHQAPGSASNMSFVEDFKDAYHVPFTVGNSPGYPGGAGGIVGGGSAAASLFAGATTPGAPRGSAPAVVSLAPPTHILESAESGLVGRKHIVTPRGLGSGNFACETDADQQQPKQPQPEQTEQTEQTQQPTADAKPVEQETATSEEEAMTPSANRGFGI